MLLGGGPGAGVRWADEFGGDGAGSRTDRIREQPEYYLNRLETQLLQTHASEVIPAGGAETLIELGSCTGDMALPLRPHMRARPPTCRWTSAPAR
ncbi:L-histidine N(alpha)-methyltransferase [Streptomyces sp. NPDC002265]|uniref:L-histidine N(alpha)-methyltransferase n=1 Tax=Streptomyces sp. NPDC002265 TaxID=3154415 RepID=UPI00331A5F67